MKLSINTSIQIQKPIEKVFEAIVNPAHMCQYFIVRSSGMMEEDKELIWHFPEFEQPVPIRVGPIIENTFISFYWTVGENEKVVEIKLEKRPDNSSVVYVTEKEGNQDEAGIQWLKGNTEGWANFLACLKAYLDHGINLRKGAFEYRF
ncbi:MAG: SRPBCC domain-containing protein [Saprospiraceae bacterium]|nr:SRPBCC domain-containing protein [Saprospiraceae bacterium]